MKNCFLFLILLINLSCANNLVSDPSMSIVKSNYPSLEILSDKKTYNGIAIFEHGKGESIDNLKLRIQGYYSGTTRIVSESCYIDEVINYSDKSLIPLGFGIEHFDPCIFSIVLSPEYPSHDTVKSLPLKGHIGVYLKKNYASYNVAMKYPTNMKRRVAIPFSNKSANLTLRGCGTRVDNKPITKSSMEGYYLHLNEYIDTAKERLCTLQGFLKNGNQFKRFRIFIAFYNNKFVPLAIPVVEFFKDYIKIKAEKIVSIISVGEEYEYNYKAKFKYKENDTIRLITSKGRLLIGKINNGAVKWSR